MLASYRLKTSCHITATLFLYAQRNRYVSNILQHSFHSISRSEFRYKVSQLNINNYGLVTLNH